MVKYHHRFLRFSQINIKIYKCFRIISINKSQNFNKWKNSTYKKIEHLKSYPKLTIFFVFEGEIRCYFLFCANNAKTLSLRYTFVAHCVFLFLTVIAVFSFSPECTVADYLPLCPVSYVKHSSLRSSLLSFLFCIYVCTIHVVQTKR